MKKIKTCLGENKEIHNDEIYVERVGGLGQFMGGIIFPKKMEGGIIKVYLNSGAVISSYLYIDGKEITDGKNYNPYKGV